nr:hypothetical protein CFP56_42670 [Quercus suber]
MVAYSQRHYDQRPQRTSILSGSDYMAEVRDDNLTNCHDMLCMTLDLFYHLVDELKHYGYLKEGKWRVDMQEAVAIFLYIVGYNTRMRPMADRFQHSTETMDRKFRRVLQAVHTYDQYLIKPDPNAVRPSRAIVGEQQGNKHVFTPPTQSNKVPLKQIRDRPFLSSQLSLSLRRLGE